MKTSTTLGILLFPIAVFSQNWTLIGPPGGRVTSICVDPQNPGTVFANTQEGFLFKTSDGGKSSKVIQDSDGPISITGEVILNPRNPDTIYGGVNRSVDGGQTWQRLAAVVVGVDPLEPRRLWGEAYGQEFLVSEDGGDHWTTVHAFKNFVGATALSPADPSVIYAAANDDTAGLYKSTDSGDTWQITSLQAITILSIAASPLDPGVLYVGTKDEGVFKTIDGGKTWNLVLLTSCVNDIAISQTNANIIYVVTGDYLYGSVGNAFKTTDGGTTWSITNHGLPSDYNRYLQSVAINPTNSDEVYIGSYGFGVYKSTNGGAAWKQVNITQASVLRIYSEPFHPNCIYAGTNDEGIAKTTDSGTTWQLLDVGVPQTVQSPFRQIQFDPVHEQIAYATGGPCGLLKSTDGGQSWHPTTLTANQDTWAWSVAVHPASPETIYVGQTGWMNRDLYRSTDGGMTWRDLQVINNAGSVEQVLIDPSSPGVIYVCGAELGFFKSTNNGESWLKLNLGLRETDPPFVYPVESVTVNELDKVIYAAQGGKGGIMKSTNGGQSWSAIDGALSLLSQTLDVQDVSGSPTNARYLYASIKSSGQLHTASYSAGGVYLTTNDGKTWNRVFNGSSGDLEFDSFDSHRIYVATPAGVYTAIESTLVGVVEDHQEYVGDAQLYQNYPNPFNGQTIIKYSMNHPGSIIIHIVNILGEEVRDFRVPHCQAGEYQLVWDGKNQRGGEVSSGVYFCRLETNSFTETKKLMLLR